ncbi:hypothetical protein QWY90_08025 [Flavobacterium paronense]|uniref:Uncharacterized protein n=1 Tax=Flavobacterium paronense TaxID=1392775 RepID=A0ABV5GH13_9FLAO|nr:hypothetical protein [Flavobacterium paronense]MDN3677260.1 hypothetical protein [Flavobacterium paronense]
MKTLFAISFFVALLWQSVFQLTYIGYWEINKEKIAKTECINRFKPMMHCNGKCQLYRELKKAADEEAENNKLPVAVLKIKTLDTFIAMPSNWQLNTISITKPSLSFCTATKGLSPGYTLSLKKPPQTLA